VLDAGIRCAASPSGGLPPGKFASYTRPADPVSPTVTTPPGYKFYDDFSGASLEWIEVDRPTFRFGYHPNKFFHLETKAPGTTVIALCPCTTPAPPISISTSAEVEPNLTNPAGTFQWGLVIRSDESGAPGALPGSYFALVVDPRNRTWRAFVHEADGKTTPMGNAQFNADEAETVELELRDHGTSIEYFVNGTYRGETPAGAKLPGGNHAGFVLTSDAAAPKVHIHFGSFGVRSGA
jgi:hypothetical protein